MRQQQQQLQLQQQYYNQQQQQQQQLLLQQQQQQQQQRQQQRQGQTSGVPSNAPQPVTLGDESSTESQKETLMPPPSAVSKETGRTTGTTEEGEGTVSSGNTMVSGPGRVTNIVQPTPGGPPTNAQDQAAGTAKKEEGEEVM